MPDLDLEPNEYQERKPNGWRWKLPWSHPVSAKTPFVGMLALLGFLGYFFVNLPEGSDVRIHGAMVFLAFIAGAMFILAFHDN